MYFGAPNYNSFN